MGHDGPRPFEDQYAAVLPGKVRRRLLPAMGEAAAQAEEFPLMGRQDCPSQFAQLAAQHIYMRRNSVYAVRIQHNRAGEIRQQAADSLFGLCRPAEARPEQNRIAGGGPFQQVPVFCRDRVGHGEGAPCGHDGVDLLRHAYEYQAAAAAHRRLSGVYRSAGVAHAAAIDVDPAEVPLVAGRPAPGQQAADKAGRDLLHRHPSCLFLLRIVYHSSHRLSPGLPRFF